MTGTMEKTVAKEKGWKPIPLPLKILFVVFLLWISGAVMNIPYFYEKGMPLFGTFVYGLSATILPLLLDFIGPVTFLYALWSRKSWAAYWAFAYNGVFILNNTIAFFTVREELGLPQILVPTIASLVFVAVIFWKQSYFERIPNL